MYQSAYDVPHCRCMLIALVGHLLLDYSGVFFLHLVYLFETPSMPPSSYSFDHYLFVLCVCVWVGARERTEDLFEVKDAMGLGYSLSTPDELAFIANVAKTTGVILDPVYCGKAAFGFAETVKKNPSLWKGKKILFLHTGGLLGRCMRFHLCVCFFGGSVHPSVSTSRGCTQLFMLTCAITMTYK